MTNILSKSILATLLILIFSEIGHAQTQRHRNVTLMGSEFGITIIAEDSLSAENYIDQAIAEISRIEELISSWKNTSQVSEINQNAGIRPVKVDREVYHLTQRALYFSQITDGTFDISIAAMDKIWKFDGSMDSIPDATSLQKAIKKVGFQNIILDSVASTIFLKIPGMKIGFGATGKSYAADQAKEILIAQNVQAGIINASGDIALWGSQLDGSPWRIGTKQPYQINQYADIIEMNKGAIVTSGDYQKFVEIDGKRYAHIINPKTGMPSSELTSVTVIGEKAEFANGLSTSIMLLGKKEGLKLIKSYPNYACLMITNSGKIIKSKNYKKTKWLFSIH